MYGTYEGHAGRQQQDPHQEVIKLFHHQLPQGLPWKGRQGELLEQPIGKSAECTTCKTLTINLPVEMNLVKQHVHVQVFMCRYY